jgi:flagellar hook assembly protein FlgD
MSTKIQISIPKPCHENWEDMTTVEKGRFCSSCQKEVIDFTKASDSQIIDSLYSNKNLCGRFSSNQLNRSLNKTITSKSNWIYLASLTGFLSLVSHKTAAQEKPITVQTDTKSDTIKIAKDSIKNSKIIKGTVSDSDGPIAEATVLIKGSQDSTYTDFDGKFEIEAQLGDKIEISYVGTSTSFIVGSNNDYDITLITDELQDDVIIIGSIEKRRTFFGRIFYKIGNLFR